MKRDTLLATLKAGALPLTLAEIQQMMDGELEKDPAEMDTELIDLCAETLQAAYEKQNTQKTKTAKRIRLGRLLPAAAVLLVLAVAGTAIAVPLARDARVTQLPDHGEYEVADPENAPEAEDLTVGYVPDGFVRTEEYEHACVYENGEQSFTVEKAGLNTRVSFDTEDYSPEPIMINGVEGVYYRPSAETGGIVFNNGQHIFMVDGNIPKEELVKIAQSLK